MKIEQLLHMLRADPHNLMFQTVLDSIDTHYVYTPTAFRNGIEDDCVANAAGTNEGSCRVFAFAQLNSLSEAETLACFAQHYRSVLDTPSGSDHANIRTFMRHGWQGVTFESQPLAAAG